MGLLAFLDLLFLLLPVELLLLALVLSGHRLHELAFVNDFIAGNFYRVAIFVDLHADNFAVGVARIAGVVGGRILGSFIGKGIDLSLFQFTLDTFFDFFALADTTTLQVLVLTLETFFVFGKGAVHNTEKVVLDLLDVLFDLHETLEEDVELFVESDHLEVAIGFAKIQEGFGFFHEFFVTAKILEKVRISLLWWGEKGRTFHSLLEVFTVLTERIVGMSWRARRSNV